MNNKDILQKVKMKIAISNVKEEDIVMKKFNIKKGIVIAAGILVVTTGGIFATNQIINKYGPNSSDGVQRAYSNEYYCNVDSEYKEANGISTNIESFLIDDNNFAININVKFDSNYKLKEMLSDSGKIDIMDLKIVNEKNEKVFATAELEREEMHALYNTEQEARENYDKYWGAYSETCEKIGENEIKFYLTATGNPKEFPVSKKLIVTFNKIRNKHNKFDTAKDEMTYNEDIYEGEWKFEIDVPTEMAKSNTINYKLVSISDENYKFEKAKLSNTAFKIYLNHCDEISWNDNQCVETSNGSRYYPAMRSDGDGGISVENGITSYYQTFNLTTFDATDDLKVHLFKTNGEEVIIELTKEK